MTDYGLLFRAIDCESLITRYELRYSCQEDNLFHRQVMRGLNFRSSVNAAHMQHESDCCRAYTDVTNYRGGGKLWGQTYTVSDSQLDDLQNEGMQSIHALAACGLPAMPKWEHE